MRKDDRHSSCSWVPATHNEQQGSRGSSTLSRSCVESTGTKHNKRNRKEWTDRKA
jgi:hypothetical protein